MLRSRFIPARNSRHRLACFALYRALLQTGRRVPLPDDVFDSNAWRNKHPIHALVRKQFQRNKNDTSDRLVYTALAAGYKFLTLLTQAAAAGSKENNAIVSFLRASVRGFDARQQRKRVDASTQPRAPPSPPRARAPPLIARVQQPTPENPDVPVKYVSTLRPRPLSALSGTRRVPRLCSTSTGFPFLRLSKPQSPRLSENLRWRIKRHQKWTYLIHEYTAEGASDVNTEDRWDRIVARQAKRERKHTNSASVAARLDLLLAAEESSATQATYQETIRDNVTYLFERVNSENEDNIARAEALGQIVESERALAKEEKEERRRKRREQKKTVEASSSITENPAIEEDKASGSTTARS